MALLVAVNDDSGSTIVMNEEFLDGYNKGVSETSGDKFLSGGFVEIQGIKSYERKGEIVRNGVILSTYALMVPVGAAGQFSGGGEQGGRREPTPRDPKMLREFPLPHAPRDPAPREGGNRIL